LAEGSHNIGPLDEGDEIEYGLSISEAGEYWAKLHAKVHVRAGENAVQASDRAANFVDAMLQHHVKALKQQLRP